MTPTSTSCVEVIVDGPRSNQILGEAEANSLEGCVTGDPDGIVSDSEDENHLGTASKKS